MNWLRGLVYARGVSCFVVAFVVLFCFCAVRGCWVCGLMLVITVCG